MIRALLKKKSCQTGLRFILFITIISFISACYPATYEVSKPSPSKRTPVTQVFFYPKHGQSTEQQSRDHYECYNWVVGQTGFDPGQSAIPPRERVKVVPMPPPGHDTAILAIAGAVLGALIAGPRRAAQGALIGAGSGIVAGAVSDASRQQYAQQMEEAYDNSDRALEAQYEAKASDFRRAMSACLEGRGYSVSK